MARRKAKVEPPTSEPITEESTAVQTVLVERSRLLVTVGPTAPCWGVPDAVRRGLPNFPKGAFVRVEPPDDASDAAVAAVREAVVEFGAEKVLVLPRRFGRVVVEPSKAAVQRSHRQVVEALVEVANVEDSGALKQLCGNIMDRVGLG